MNNREINLIILKNPIISQFITSLNKINDDSFISPDYYQRNRINLCLKVVTAFKKYSDLTSIIFNFKYSNQLINTRYKNNTNLVIEQKVLYTFENLSSQYHFIELLTKDFENNNSVAHFNNIQHDSIEAISLFIKQFEPLLNKNILCQLQYMMLENNLSEKLQQHVKIKI